MSSKGVTPRSVRFQLQDNTDECSAAQHSDEQQGFDLSASQTEDARLLCASMTEGADGVKTETSFALSKNGELDAAVGCTLDSLTGNSDSRPATVRITTDQGPSTDAPLLLETTQLENAHGDFGKENTSSEDNLDACLKQMLHQLESTWDIFEAGRELAKVGLGGLPD